MSEFWRPRCDGCGRFTPYERPDGSSWLFVPDSHVSCEESIIWCPDCTEKNGGPPVSLQNVNSSRCSGIVRKDPDA